MITIHLYHTNDLHSHFENWPAIVTYLENKREEHRQNGELALFLDIGDHMDRANLVTEGTLGQVNVALLNQIKMDFVTIGNNEGITFTKDDIAKAYEGRKFPIILANLFDEEGEYPEWAIPYAIHEFGNGLKVGLMGMTAPFSPFYTSLGWKVVEPLTLLPSIVEELRQKTDLLVLMSHLGFHADQQIAREITGIDAILGAHTHHLLKEGLELEETIIGQAGKFCRFIGKTTIVYDLDAHQVKNRKMEAIKVDTSPSQEALKVIRTYEKRAESKLREPVVTLTQAMPVDWFKESPFAKKLASALREWCDADCSMVNSGVILASLNKGTVTKGVIHELCPHPINPCKVYLTGKEIKAVIRVALQPDFENLALKGFGFRGVYLGKMIYDRLSFDVLGSHEDNQVTNVLMNGEAIDDEKIYSVATIDTFTFGKLIPPIKSAKDKSYYLPETLRDLLEWKLLKDDHLEELPL